MSTNTANLQECGKRGSETSLTSLLWVVCEGPRGGGALLGVGGAAGDERALERDEITIEGDRAPVADKVLVARDVPAEDGRAEFGNVHRHADEGDEAVVHADAAVEAVVVPGLAMLRKSLSSIHVSTPHT